MTAAAGPLSGGVGEGAEEEGACMHAGIWRVREEGGGIGIHACRLGCWHLIRCMRR